MLLSLIEMWAKSTRQKVSCNKLELFFKSQRIIWGGCGFPRVVRFYYFIKYKVHIVLINYCCVFVFQRERYVCVLTQSVYLAVCFRERRFRDVHAVQMSFLSWQDLLLMSPLSLWLTASREEQEGSPTQDHLSESAGAQLMMFRINLGAVDFTSRMYAS